MLLTLYTSILESDEFLVMFPTDAITTFSVSWARRRQRAYSLHFTQKIRKNNVAIAVVRYTASCGELLWCSNRGFLNAMGEDEGREVGLELNFEGGGVFNFGCCGLVGCEVWEEYEYLGGRRAMVLFG